MTTQIWYLCNRYSSLLLKLKNPATVYHQEWSQLHCPASSQVNVQFVKRELVLNETP